MVLRLSTGQAVVEIEAEQGWVLAVPVRTDLNGWECCGLEAGCWACCG